MEFQKQAYTSTVCCKNSNIFKGVSNKYDFRIQQHSASLNYRNRARLSAHAKLPLVQHHSTTQYLLEAENTQTKHITVGTYNTYLDHWNLGLRNPWSTKTFSSVYNVNMNI